MIASLIRVIPINHSGTLPLLDAGMEKSAGYVDWQLSGGVVEVAEKSAILGVG